MADFADKASDREELDRDIALTVARRQVPDLPAFGLCYNCDAPLPDGVRFCDSECRNDYTTRKRCEALRG